MKKPKVGLLPLYIELYDRALPQMRERVEQFRQTIASELEGRELSVIAAPVCRVKTEFEAAIRSFEEAEADAVVTLHLAYSPSLESAAALAGTKLPIIVLDTTPTDEFGPHTHPDELLYNHGIHGVQDMCNLLIRNGKAFKIEAGHWRESDVLDRVAGWARAARIAHNMRNGRVGRIGPSFEGMGDFAVAPEVLRSTIGVVTVPADPEVIRSLVPSEGDAEVAAEMLADLDRFVAVGLDPAVHRRSIRAGLAVRRWIEKERLTAFTFNFLSITKASGLPTVPFLEASKAMARGIGFAGEGDVLTAALVGALASIYPDTTFTEMFCPDWKNESIFLSHMGEMNIALADDNPRLLEKAFPWTDVDSPLVAVGRFRPGPAVHVNLAPGRNNTYTLIVSPVEMLDVKWYDRMEDSIHGWFKPGMPIADFLAAYSRAGGTHHSALVYGEVADEIAGFGEMMGWEVEAL